MRFRWLLYLNDVKQAAKINLYFSILASGSPTVQVCRALTLETVFLFLYFLKEEPFQLFNASYFNRTTYSLLKRKNMGFACVAEETNICTCLQLLSGNKIMIMIMIRFMRHMKQHMAQIVNRHLEDKPTRTISIFLHTNHSSSVGLGKVSSFQGSSKTL